MIKHLWRNPYPTPLNYGFIIKTSFIFILFTNPASHHHPFAYLHHVLPLHFRCQPLARPPIPIVFLSPVYLAGPVISHLYYHQHFIKSDFIIIGVSFYSFQKSLPPLYSFVTLGLLFHEHHRLPTPMSPIHLSACTDSLHCYHRCLKSKFIITMITLEDLPAVAATHPVPYSFSIHWAILS